MMAYQTNTAVQAIQPTSSIMTRWVDALRAPTDSLAVATLREVYQDAFPLQGEIIFTGACNFTCEHCIYPPDFVRHNKMLSIDDWISGLVGLNNDLGVSSFVYGGRTVTNAGLEMLASLRSRLPDSHIGLIDNGLSMIPYKEALDSIRPNWIDISFDGMPDDHDKQRNRSGSFKAALDSTFDLVRHEYTTQINVLTCLTSVNRNSVIQMIRELNAKGLKNFFVTPVVVVDDVRPAAALAISAESLLRFLDEVDALLGSLDDAYVEVGLFEAEHLAAIGHKQPWRLAGFLSDGDHMAWTQDDGNSRFSIRYSPTSLTGVREFIINTNGDVIAPKAMASGLVPKEKIFGNVTRQTAADIWAQVPNVDAFQVYVDALINERQILKDHASGLGEE